MKTISNYVLKACVTFTLALAMCCSLMGCEMPPEEKTEVNDYSKALYQRDAAKANLDLEYNRKSAAANNSDEWRDANTKAEISQQQIKEAEKILSKIGDKWNAEGKL